jgi:hypothetical protein
MALRMLGNTQRGRYSRSEAMEIGKINHRLACGCILGMERCADCSREIDPDQEIALMKTITRLKEFEQQRQEILKARKAARKANILRQVHVRKKAI